MNICRLGHSHYSNAPSLPLRFLNRYRPIIHNNTNTATHRSSGLLDNNNRTSLAPTREQALNSLCSIPVVSPPLVPGLYAATTLYAGGIALLFLYTATKHSLGLSQGHGDEVVYSSDELKQSRGRGRRSLLSDSRMRTRMLLRLLFPLVIVYAVLLVKSYEPDMLQLILPGSLKDGLSSGFNPQFFPNIKGIATLFSRATTTASLWVHVVCINIFSAHTLMWKGIDLGIPTQHTILVSMVFGPLGFLSHWMTLKCL